MPTTHEQATKPELMAPRAEILLGIRFHCVTMKDAYEQIKAFIQSGTAHQVCLSNAYTVSLCWKDNELRQGLDRADLVLADGMSIVWGGRLIGVTIPGRIAGPDLAEYLCEQSERAGHRVFFLGSTPENLAQLKQELLVKWPKLQIVGMFSPPMCAKLSDSENELIFAQLKAAKPDILFVGMSTPKQEKWIAANRHHLTVPVSIGIGAAFDFISGRIQRAPMHIQDVGLEWLYRLWCEPRRLWKRYLLGNAIFLAHLFWAWTRYQVRSFSKFSLFNILFNHLPERAVWASVRLLFF